MYEYWPEDDPRANYEGPEPPISAEELARDEMHEQMEAEVDHEDPGCQCNVGGGLYELGSVESIKSGDTDPYCPRHGVDEVVSGQYAQWNPAQRAEFDRRLTRHLRDA